MESELNQLHRNKIIYQTFLSNLIWYLFTSSALIMRKLAKKQQLQVQTIQITVATRNVTQDNGNMNNFWKGSRWFFRQCLRTLSYILRPEWLFGKLHLCPSIYTQTCINWPSVLHSLHALPVAVLTIPANSAAASHAKSAKRLVDSHVFFQTRTHLH